MGRRAQPQHRAAECHLLHDGVLGHDCAFSRRECAHPRLIDGSRRRRETLLLRASTRVGVASRGRRRARARRRVHRARAAARRALTRTNSCVAEFEQQTRILKRISHLNFAPQWLRTPLSFAVVRRRSGPEREKRRELSDCLERNTWFHQPIVINARHDDTHETTFRDSAQCAMASALRPQPTSLPAPSAERPTRRDERCDRCILGLELVE